ncbi:MAG: hypothetical protein KDD55_09335 [Bdellovibrionales bacterium]|nr:hypothetical protein [Bdellovibrionales bacterium]
MSFATALNRLTGGRLAGQPKGQGQFHSEAAQLLELSHALRDVGSIYWRSIRGHVTLSDEQRESVRGLPLQQKPGVSEIQEWSVHASRSVTFRRGQPVIPLPGGAEQFNLSFVGPSIGYYFTISELGQVIET